MKNYREIIENFAENDFPNNVNLHIHSTYSDGKIEPEKLIEQAKNKQPEEYLQTYEVQVMMDLLKIIDNPYQDLPLVHIMLSPIGMFTNDDLLEIRLADKNDDFYTTHLKSRLSATQSLKEKIEEFLNKIDSFRELNNDLD